MCIHLFNHHTTPEHESRWVSVINPVTGYAVSSPFQHPRYMTCEAPCIREAILLSQRCEWHQSCCRLYCQILPCQAPVQCMSPRICLHLYEGEYEKLPLGFLDHLQTCDPLLLDTLSQLFLCGIELSLANLFGQQLTYILTEPSRELSPSSRSYLEWRRDLFRGVVDMNEEHLGQLARFLDLCGETTTGSGSYFPPRPGRERRPELNGLGPTAGFPFLRAVSWAGEDGGPVPWPDGVSLWPDLAALIRRFSGASNFVPWAGGLPIRLGNTTVSVEYLADISDVLAGAAPGASASRDPRPLPLSGGDTMSGGRLRRSPEQGGDDEDYDSSQDAECDPDYDPPLPPRVAEDDDADDNANDSDGDEGKDEGEDEEDTYLIEALVAHRPAATDRAKVRHYKVRWLGDWPASQKQTWEPFGNIAESIIDEYWADLEKRKQQPPAGTRRGAKTKRGVKGKR